MGKLKYKSAEEQAKFFDQIYSYQRMLDWAGETKETEKCEHCGHRKIVTKAQHNGYEMTLIKDTTTLQRFICDKEGCDGSHCADCDYPANHPIPYKETGIGMVLEFRVCRHGTNKEQFIKYKIPYYTDLAEREDNDLPEGMPMTPEIKGMSKETDMLEKVVENELYWPWVKGLNNKIHIMDLGFIGKKKVLYELHDKLAKKVMFYGQLDDSEELGLEDGELYYHLVIQGTGGDNKPYGYDLVVVVSDSPYVACELCSEAPWCETCGEGEKIGNERMISLYVGNLLDDSEEDDQYIRYVNIKINPSGIERFELSQSYEEVMDIAETSPFVENIIHAMDSMKCYIADLERNKKKTDGE